MNATTRWRGSSTARRAVVVAIATALLATGVSTSSATAAPTPSASAAPAAVAPLASAVTATRSWTQSETVTAQEWATVGTFVGYGTATATASATASATYTAAADWEADYWATWNAYLAASEQAKAKADAQARTQAKAIAQADAQAQFDANALGFDATETWTQVSTATIDETYVIGDVVGHGSATETASVTLTRSYHAATLWEAQLWAFWTAYIDAVTQSQAAAEAKARPIAKARAKADAESKVAAGVSDTQSYTVTQTVTVNETATVGDFVGQGTATSTKTVTATKTVTYPTHWEAYYWAVVLASVDATNQAQAQADADARVRAKAIAQADAQAQYDAAQVPVDPNPGGGTTPPTGPDCGAQVLKSNGTPWSCTFVDEFRGTQLDQTKWHPIDTEESTFSYGDCFLGDRNITVSNGVLKLSTIREDQPVTCDHPNGPITADYTSAAVTTNHKFSQAFGRYEIRAAMPASNGPGLQSALWMLPETPKYGAWPGSGEIDIVEFYSQYPDRLVPALHYNSLLPWGTRTNNNCLVYQPTAFHTYVLEWTAQTMKISIDGTTCLEHTISPLAPLVGSAPYDQPFNLNLTQMLGSGDNAFPAGQGVDEATMQVDYVRVWK